MNYDSYKVACDSYAQTDRDIQNILDIGLKNYRFSISWTRLMPNGTRKDQNTINKQGIEHYRNFIGKLVEAGITPFVTIYHWDLPQALQVQFLFHWQIFEMEERKQAVEDNFLKQFGM